MPIQLPAISLWQPWATMVVLGVKRFETRSWSTGHVGPLCIHATKSIPTEARFGIERLLLSDEFREVLFPRGYSKLSDFPMGAIIGTTTLERCLATSASTRGFVRGHGESRGVDEIAFGDYKDGRFAWALENPRELTTPVECRGAQGIWEVPPPIAAIMAEQLRPIAATLDLPLYKALGYNPALYGTNIPIRAELPSGQS